MEHFALLILEWMGKVIAQKLAGSALQAAWSRISPALKDVIKDAQFWRLQAGERLKAEEKNERTNEILISLLDEAAQEINRLKAENETLRARLAKYQEASPGEAE